jgi:DtxR family Mn-dependent transcriptional regulator
MLSKAVENYLKAIFSLSENRNDIVSTNSIAKKLNTKASSVTDMLRKLKLNKLVNHEKYKGVSLTKKGKKLATNIVRKHRLWETFLVEKLHFNWDEVHDVAEQLEHIKSDKLITLLDEFLGNPKFDPHGDPIPDEFGKFPTSNSIPLSKLKEGNEGIVMGVSQDNSTFLKFLDKIDIKLGNLILVKDIIEFDSSVEILINNKESHISLEVARNILVKQK